MTRKSVPRQKRDDRPQPMPTGNQQAGGADSVRAKLHDRRRRHHQHGEAGRHFNLTNMVAVAGVVAVLAIAAYYWYISVIRDIVRTPLQAPRFGDPTPSTSQQDMGRFWGSYRSGLYFGMKTRSPRSPVVGLMWMPQVGVGNGLPPIRHWCNQDDQLPAYGWVAHDGINFGAQEIIDKYFIITTDFVKKQGGTHGGDWSARFGLIPRVESAKQLPVSLFVYMALDGDGQLMSEVTDDWLSAVIGQSQSLGDFHLVFPKPASKVRYNYLVSYTPSLDKIEETLVKAFRLFPTKNKNPPEHYIGLSGKAMPEGMPESRANIIVYQVTVNSPFQMEVAYESGSFTDRQEPLLGEAFQSEFSKHRHAFETRFESVFSLAEHGFNTTQIAFAHAALSNMLGSIGYFYGSSLVHSRYTSEPIDYWQAGLYTAVPSRSFFPRGFLWDEGFHQLLISSWDETLSRDIIGHWLDLINIEGWIPREQILGSEARARVPDDFVVQFNENANPPALFLPLRRIINNLIASNNVQDRQYLRTLFPRLRAWYGWFNRTQSGTIPSSYRWRGRNATTVKELNPKTLTSGLDDYPRASHPTADERHVDLRCWMAVASGIMKDLTQALNESSARIYSVVHTRLMDNDLLDQLHWSESMKRYSDYGLHTDSVRLERPPPPPNIQPGQRPPPPREKERVVRREPSLGFVDSSFGYVNLFPFLLRILAPDSSHLGHILNDLRQPDLLWTPFGLRSLAKTSPMYGKHNTEHDPPYWRGSIWINVNYLALAALQHYSTAAVGPNSSAAASLYDELRTNVIDNVFRQYQSSGYIWEQYSDTTGEGKGSHPFTGWSALVVAIMAEDFY